MAATHSQAQLQYASILARLMAFVLDLVVLAACSCVFIAAGGIPLLVASDLGQRDPPPFYYYLLAGVLVAYIPFVWLYYIVSWAWRGRTVGQMAMGLRVVRRSGRPVGLGSAVLRLLGYLLSLLTLLLGFLMAILDEERRALHDRLAGTVVVREL